MTAIAPGSLLRNMSLWRAAAKPWKPWPYQERALKFMLTDPQCGLLLDPGLGKTSIDLAATKVLLEKRLIKRNLVVAPLRAIYDVWPAETCDWKDFNDLGIAIIHGPNKEQALRRLGPEHKIILINPEGFEWLGDKKSRIKELGADMLTVDESSKWKNSTTVRFRSLRKMLHLFKRRYILTGSPRPRNYLDLFGQIYIIDRGATLGSYVTHYRNQFFYPTGFEMREWAPLPDSPAKINALVAPMVLRLDAKDYLKLPKDPERTHRVVLPAKVQAEYDKIEESLMSTLFSAPLTSSASARAKCCQIANGAVYMDPGPGDLQLTSKNRPVQVVHTAKVDALVDLYEELQGEPILVGIGYRHDVDQIRKALGKDIPCIHGGVTRTQSADYIDRWNKGKLPIMLVHPASAGHALNLQKFNARHVAYFYLPDDYDQYDQLFRRVWRQGNKADFVMRHYFVAQGTVDVAKMNNLRRKGDEQNGFLRAMKEYCEEKYGPIKGRI